MTSGWPITDSDEILVSGAGGFLGSRVLETLLGYGFKKIRASTRSERSHTMLSRLATSSGGRLEVVRGNLLSREYCRRITRGVALVLHCAAGVGKSFAGCFMGSVVTTRNLIEASLGCGSLKRFVNVSSLAVHSGLELRQGSVLDETCALETEHMLRYDPYCYGKVKQDELVMKYGRERHLPWVIVRPGPVYGPGREKLPGRIGVEAFGLFFEIGGSTRPPIIYVDNCADAIVMAGLAKGVEGETFIAVDDDRPTCRQFLKLYKAQVRHLRSVHLPRFLYYVASRAWESYSRWSLEQLPPVFNRREYAAYWKPFEYSNRKLKARTGWRPRVSFQEAAARYFAYLREARGTA